MHNRRIQTRTDPEIFGAVPPRRKLGHDALPDARRQCTVLTDSAVMTYQTPGAHDHEVGRRVRLLAEPVHLRLLPDAEPARGGLAHVDEEGLADEGPEDDVVRDEDEVEPALLVSGIGIRGTCDAMRNEEHGLKGVPEPFRNEGRQELPVGPQEDADDEELQGGFYQL